MLRRLIFAAAFALAAACFAETDYPSKDDLRALQRRVESLESGFSASVQLTPGGSWSNVPGWRSLQLAPAAGATLAAAKVGDVLRVTIRAPQAASGAVTNVGWGLVGSGTTNPLSVDPSVLAPSTTNFGPGLVGSGTTNPLSVDPGLVAFTLAPRDDQAYLAWDAASNGYRHVYGPRAVLDASAAMSLHAASNLPVLRPGQLLYLDVAADGNRHVYACTASVDTTSFATNDFTWLPLGAADAFWSEFVRQGVRGQAGASGSAGTDGLDGVGNVQYGIWDVDKAYVYDTSTPIVVSYAGRWYDCVASSTGVTPTAVGATNWWAISVDKGDDGEVIGWTNLVFRDSWDSGTEYTTNDAVWYLGNLFTVGPTNSDPGIGEAPAFDGADKTGEDNEWWTLLLSRGERGLAGPAGADGDEINHYSVYSLLPGTNTLFSNDPSATNRIPRWVSTSGGDLTMEWTGSSWAGTNRIDAAGGRLKLNGTEQVFPTQAVLAVAGGLPATSSWAGGTAPLLATNLPLPELRLVANAVGGAPSTSAWDAASATLTLSDLAVPSSGSGATNSVPVVDSGTVDTGVWTVDFRDGPAQLFTLSVPATAVVCVVDSTNNSAYAEALLFSGTNSVTWVDDAGASRFVWSTGSTPTLSTNQNNVLMFRSRRGRIHATYVGTEP